MKQHERTHKPGHGSRGGSAADSFATTTGVASGRVRKRTMSGSTMASLASSSSVTAVAQHHGNGVDDDDSDDDDDEEDADGDVDMDLTPQPQQQPQPQDPTQQTIDQQQQQYRPPMGKSKLSEILEQVSTSQADMDMAMDADGDGDADGEGESPGLDALASVAAGEIGAQQHRSQQSGEGMGR